MEVSTDFDLRRQGSDEVVDARDQHEPDASGAEPAAPVSSEVPSETVENPQPRRASWRGFGFR